MSTKTRWWLLAAITVALLAVSASVAMLTRDGPGPAIQTPGVGADAGVSAGVQPSGAGVSGEVGSVQEQVEYVIRDRSGRVKERKTLGH